MKINKCECGWGVFKRNWFEKLFRIREFCINCGRPTDSAMEVNCVGGHNMSSFAKFCKKCGSPRKYDDYYWDNITITPQAERDYKLGNDTVEER